jgi:hypothetical protein
MPSEEELGPRLMLLGLISFAIPSLLNPENGTWALWMGIYQKLEWIFDIVYQLVILHNSEEVIHIFLVCEHRLYQNGVSQIFSVKSLIWVLIFWDNNSLALII